MGTPSEASTRSESVDIGWAESLPDLADWCLLCPEPPEHGLLCPTCRTNLRTVNEFSRRRLASLMRTLVSCWDDDARFDRAASLMVEPMRGVLIVRCVTLLEFGVASRAPEAVIENLMTKLCSAANPRNVNEVFLLMPNQEEVMILMHAGVYEELRGLPLRRHLRALKPRFPNPVVLRQEDAQDISELITAWASNEPSEHWRMKVIRGLKIAERPALRQTLLEGTQAKRIGDVFNDYIDGAQFLAKDVDELGQEEPIEAYLKRVLAEQTKATREILPRKADRERLVSGDAAAYEADEDSEDGASLWERISARVEGPEHAAVLSDLVVEFDLTPREREILKLQQEGFKQVEIAAQLGISQPRVSQILEGMIRRVSARVRF